MLNKPNQLDNDEQDDDSIFQRRIDGQWVYTVALREALTIAMQKSVTYEMTLQIADKLAPEILGRQLLLFKPGESKEARFYREKAQRLSEKRTRENRAIDGRKTVEVTPIQAIDEGIAELQDLLKAGNGTSHHLRGELEKLLGVRKELEKSISVHRGEQEILLKDWKLGLDLPNVFSQENNYDIHYHDFALPDHRIMRIRMIHTLRAETLTGADLIYEYHRPLERKARLAAVQYKVPDKGSENIIIDERMQRQLDKLRDVFCKEKLCDESVEAGEMKSLQYRLPCCCAFFRPTDRLQAFDTRLATTGYHIRRCDIESVCAYTTTGKKQFTPTINRIHGISSAIFEELFNTERLGSKWLTYEELERFHRTYEIIKSHEQASIYIQETSAPLLR